MRAKRDPDNIARCPDCFKFVHGDKLGWHLDNECNGGNMNTIDMQPVKSSQIDSVGYDPATKTLAVKFLTGGIYHYANVEPEAFDALKSADSIGKHFGQHIRGNSDKYPHTKVVHSKGA